MGAVWLRFPSLPPPYPPRSPQGSPAADVFLPQPPGAHRWLPWHGGGIWGSRPSWAPHRATAGAKTKGGRLRFPTKPRLMLADMVPMATAFNAPAAASSPFRLLLCASVRRSGAGNLPERAKGGWRGLQGEERNGGGVPRELWGSQTWDPPPVTPAAPKFCSRSAGWGHHQTLPLPAPGWGNSSLGGFSLCVT